VLNTEGEPTRGLDKNARGETRGNQTTLPAEGWRCTGGCLQSCFTKYVQLAFTGRQNCLGLIEAPSKQTTMNMGMAHVQVPRPRPLHQGENAQESINALAAGILGAFRAPPCGKHGEARECHVERQTRRFTGGYEACWRT